VFSSWPNSRRRNRQAYYQYSTWAHARRGDRQQASGRPYADYVRQAIIRPGPSTTPEVPAEERGERLATGYGALSRQGTRATLPLFQARGIAPAAGFASTVEDLGRFAQWQFRLLSRGGTEVLAANTLKEMQRVH
jgi:CubicO group peptidase (beta-lactamase class C family)